MNDELLEALKLTDTLISPSFELDDEPFFSFLHPAESKTSVEIKKMFSNKLFIF